MGVKERKPGEGKQEKQGQVKPDATRSGKTDAKK